MIAFVVQFHLTFVLLDCNEQQLYMVVFFQACFSRLGAVFHLEGTQAHTQNHNKRKTLSNRTYSKSLPLLRYLNVCPYKTIPAQVCSGVAKGWEGGVSMMALIVQFHFTLVLIGCNE